MSDIEAFELLDPTESSLKNVLVIDKRKRKIILCLTLIVVLILIILNLSLLQKQDSHYPDIQQINDFLKQCLIDFPKYTEVFKIGRSVESRDITAISIEEKETEVRKPLVWIVCGIHAREWTSPLTCLHFISNILDSVTDGKDDVLRRYRYKIIPVANPDGYVYSHIGDRLARKNRNSSGCPQDEFNGVDLNRNFPVGFNNQGSHSGVCNDTYPGTQPFSEVETRALRDAGLADIPEVFLSVHGNAQMLLTPYAYKASATKPRALNVSGTLYPYGPASSVIYEVGGTMMDWVAEDLGVKRTFTLELRSLCDGETEELTICHWQPEIALAQAEILPQAWEIFHRIMDRQV